MRVSPATPSDLSGCALIIESQPLWDRYQYTPQRALRDLQSAITHEDHRVWVARGAELVGFAWIVKRGARARSDYLRLIAVRRGEEGTGVGAALLHAAEADAHAGVFLLVSDFNHPAQRFYARR